MPKNVRANIELGVNIVIAVAVVVVAAVVVKRYAFRQPANAGSVLQQQQTQITTGARINVPSVDWEQNKKTLVFFLKKDCVYCKSSAPFYRQLIADASKRNVKWLAILPNSVEEGREYVRSLELPIENVQTGSLPSYKIPGTPTVLFVDNKGTVRSVWIGDVAGRENEVRDELVGFFDAKISSEASATPETLNKSGGTQQAQSSTLPAPDLEAAELKKLVDAKTPITIIDIDERTEYKKGHIPHSKNIPVDEMASRALREIPKDARVVLYCRCKGGGASDSARAGLREQGYSQISILKGGMDSWKNLGLSVTTSDKE
jgi:rhodanese-related sulfurtransferase